MGISELAQCRGLHLRALGIRTGSVEVGLMQDMFGPK